MVTTNLLRDEFWPGNELGDFKLLERIGAGGEGSVWSAWDKKHHRIVAIKFFPKRSPSPDSLSIHSEAQIIQRLDHPSILKIYEISEMGNSDYFCMQYFPSGSLDELMITKNLLIKDVLQITAQIVDALEYIHSQGIVHRDLKPTNVMVDAQSRVYLTDFGIARSLSETTMVYHTGQGTFRYSPPEQHTEGVVSQAADVYSLGLIIFELLTGELPWGGEVSLAIKQLDTGEEIPDPRDVNPVLPDTLKGVLRKLTNADPNKRPTSAVKAFGCLVAGLAGKPIENISPEGSVLVVNKTLQSVPPLPDDKTFALKEAEVLLEKSLTFWDPDSEEFKLYITHFAFLDSVYSSFEKPEDVLDLQQRLFMTRGALTHGLNQDFWWKTLDDLSTRVKISELVVAVEEEETIVRALSLMLKEPLQGSLSGTVSASMTTRLINMALESESSTLRRKVFDFIGKMVGSAKVWQQIGFSEADDITLATIAISENPQAVLAAQLIGKIQSEKAVETIWESQKDGDVKNSRGALVEVLRIAGSLPKLLPSKVRLQAWGELARNQLFANGFELLKTYLAASLAGALSLGLHVMATFRGPSFLNSDRILDTFGSGLMFGPLIGLGIFIIRMIVHRLRILSLALRILLSIGFGTIVIYSSFYFYHQLFMHAVPKGWLILVGSFVIAIGFGLGGGLFRSKWLRMLISAASIGLGLGFSWYFSTLWQQTPMIYYELDQPVKNNILILITSLILGFVPYLVDSLDKE